MLKKDKEKSRVATKAKSVADLKSMDTATSGPTTYYAYILKCADNTLYVGSTNNLEKRFVQHNTSKQGAHYTKIRRPVVLMYSEKFTTFSESRKREAELKRLSRVQKLQIIKQ